jgi:hypothetical protein
LFPQHSRAWGRRIGSLRPAWTIQWGFI